MVRKITLITFLGIMFNNLYSQTYYIQDDSVSLSLKVETSKKDSLSRVVFKFKNNSQSNLFLCKLDFRKYVVYINSIDGPLIFGCGCEYGFNQDYPNKNKYDIVKIGKKDSLIFEISGKDLRLKTNRKMTYKEFFKKDKVIKFDYVLSNNPLAFLDPQYFYDDFMRYKKSLTVFMSGK